MDRGVHEPARRRMPNEWIANEPENGAWIPGALTDSGLQMVAAKMVAGNDIPTFVIGIVDRTAYTEVMWRNDTSRIKTLFATNDRYHELRVRPMEGNPGKVDTSYLHLPILAAINQLNEWNTEAVRIVRLGKGSSAAIYRAVTDLIEGWNQQTENKTVHFITTGDSTDQELLNYCKWLCIDKTCSKVYYYNTLDYTLIGRIDQARRPNQGGREIRESKSEKALITVLFLIAVLLLLILLHSMGLSDMISFCFKHAKQLPVVDTVLSMIW